MQVTQTLSEGLKRQFRVVVSAADLAARFEAELGSIRGKVNLNGFRPGKVPTAHIKRIYGRSVMGEVVQSAVGDARKQIASEQGVRFAGEPKLTFSDEQDLFERVYAGKADLDFSLDVEVLPTIEIQDHSGIFLTRQVAATTEADVQETLERMAAATRAFEPREDAAAACDGDQLVIDFCGSIDGEAFEGGTAEGAELVLGSGQFIPGFEDQLLGARKGESRTVKVTFPADYGSQNLAGKAAEFAVTVHAVKAPGDIKIDDALAQKFGLGDAGALTRAVKTSLDEEHKDVARQRIKRALLDQLDALYVFELPQNMVEQEFQSVWSQVQADSTRSGRPIEDNEENRAEYRKIAERRVRLGLVLSEVGSQAAIKIEDAEVSRALLLRARQFPGEEKQFLDYYRSNPQALAEIRAPLFEEKVVDHIIAGARVAEQSVTRAELMAEEQEEVAPAQTENPKKAKSVTAGEESAKLGEESAKAGEENEAGEDVNAAAAEKPKKAAAKKKKVE